MYSNAKKFLAAENIRIFNITSTDVYYKYIYAIMICIIYLIVQMNT